MIGSDKNHTSFIRRIWTILCLIPLLFLLAIQDVQAQYDIQVNTMVRQPVSPYLLGLANAQGDINRTGLTNDIVDNLAVILTNTGSQQRAIKLHARIERIAPGPMGITVKESYQPESPIFLGPNQTLQLNPNIISEAFGRFSTNDLVFENTSLSELRSNAVNYKLPEGQYRICVTAYDYNHPGHSMPLSVIGTGCANFTICYSASAPQFVMPVSSMGSFNQDFEEITPHSSQIQFTWTPSITTCGLPMGALYYDLEIREIFPGQLKTDALNNPPVFERKNIPTTTFLLDTIRFPNVLVKDQRYIVRVKANLMQQANSPLIIDNDGYSEIIGIIYKPQAIVPETEIIADSQEEGSEEESDLLTNKVKGKLTWVFRKSEEDYEKPRSPINIPLYTPLSDFGVPLDLFVQSPVNYYMGNDLLLQNNYTALTQVDPTLNIHDGFVTDYTMIPLDYAIGEVDESDSYDKPTTVSSSRANSIYYENENVGTTKGSKKHPLEGATVQLKVAKTSIGIDKLVDTPIFVPDNPIYMGGRTSGAWADIISEGPGINVPEIKVPGIKVPQPNSIPIPRNRGGFQPNIRGPNPSHPPVESASIYKANAQQNITEEKWDVIATGITDANGNFNLEFLNEEFLENVVGEKLMISVNQPGFYHFSYEIPQNKIQGSIQETDLGEFTLVANTFRFTPSVKDVLLENSSFPMDNLKIDIYRESNVFSSNAFLKYEGNHNVGQSRETKTFNGKQYYKISSVSLSESQESLKSYDFGKLFAYKDFYIEISSENSGLEPLTTDLRVRTTNNLKSEIAHVYAEYEQTFEPSAVEGRVILYSDDNEVPIENAVVRISYSQSDVLNESPTDSGIFISNPITPQFDFSMVNTDGFTGVNPYESTIPAFNGTTWPMTTFSHQSSNNTNNSSTQVPSSTTYKYVPLEVTYLGEDISPGMQDVMFGGGLLANGLGTTATTDESGYFYIGNLPKLKQGANYTLTLVSVPSSYEDLPVDPVDKKMEFSIAPGITPFKQFKLTPEVTPLIGKVVDEEGEAIANAKLHFEKSNSYFETDQSGVFQTTYFPGTHTLIVEKNGYVKKEGVIEIESSAVKVNRPLVQELVTVGSTEAGESLTENDFPSYVGIVNSTISGANLLPSGIISPFSFFSPSYDFFGGSEAESSSSTVSEVIDIGEIGYLERKRAKIQFVVKDKDTNEPIEGVNIHVFDTINTTNVHGEWLYEGFGGNTIVTMTPPKDSKYVAIKNEVEFPANNELVEEVFYLEEGVRAYGKATIAGATQAIDSVRIRVDDKEYISTFTNDKGEYQLYVPKGEQTIKASKVGYISAQATHEFVEDDIKIDFELEDGGGLNINQLLGFAIELEEAQKNEDGSQTWTGEFVGLDFYLPIIELDNETNLKFTDIKVTFDDDGNAIPESNQVAINKSSLNAKLFEYIPLEFSNEEENQIVVKKDENGSWGSISGHIKLDPFRIISHEMTRDMLEDFAPTILPDKVANILGGSTPGSIEFFMGQGADRLPSLGNENEDAFKEWLQENNIPVAAIEEEIANIQNIKSQLEELKFYFSLAFNDSVEINIYDFDLILDAEKSWIGKDGLNLAGQINTPKIGPLDPLEIPIEELTFDTSFELKKLTAEVKNIPALKFGDVLHAHVNQLQISENGISTGGVVTLKLPSSEPSYLKLSNLRISKNGISGGKFDFSLDGLEEEIKQRAKTAANDLRQNIEQEISVFGAAVIRDNGSNISFGQVSNTGAYYLSGGVNMKFTKYIKKEVKINNFMVSTDGDFALDVPTNYAADFGFAGFNLNGIEVRYIQNLPALRLDGGFDINLNIISFDASGLTFQANQSGGMDVKIDKIGATLDIPAIAANVELEVGTNDAGDQGFSGNGGFEIPGTNFGAAFAFRYYKGPVNIDVGAEFAVGATIPVGGIVSLTRVGGGFYYEKNQNQYKTTIKIISGVGITGVDNIYKIDPLEVEVQTGTASKPVIKGTGNLTVVNSINMAEASIVLDLNEKNFSIEIKGEFEPIKAVSGTGTGLARVSWKNDLYIFLGVQSSYKIAGLFDAYGDFALGYNIKPAVRRQSDVTGYFRSIDEDLLGRTDTFSGAFVSAGTSFSAGPYKGDIWIASVSAGFGYSADAFVFLNFPSTQPSQATLSISLGGELNGSAEVGVLGMDLIGARVGACFRITGGYNNSIGWNLNGRIAAGAEFNILKAPRNCNSANWFGFIPVGAKVCGHANLSVGYKQRGSNSGLDLSGSFGKDSNGQKISCN